VETADAAKGDRFTLSESGCEVSWVVENLSRENRNETTKSLVVRVETVYS